jgi:tetratricopeptide (TPR) repeat protein
VQPVDPAPAWREGVRALTFLTPSATALKAPPGWPTLVAAHEPIVSLAFCIGNFPQMMRNLHLLLHGNPAKLRPTPGQPIDLPELLAWAAKVAGKKQYPELLVALGSLRLARQFEAADRVIGQHDVTVPEEWRAAWENEKAALAWHRGNAEEALASWQKQKESVPVLFNRGMAALFLGRTADAAKSLAKVVSMLPESSAWHHLARLYLTLAQTRS